VTDLGSDSALVILPATDLAMRSVTAPELALDSAMVTMLVKAMVLGKAFEKATVRVFPAAWHWHRSLWQPMIVR